MSSFGDIPGFSFGKMIAVLRAISVRDTLLVERALCHRALHWDLHQYAHSQISLRFSLQRLLRIAKLEVGHFV